MRSLPSGPGWEKYKKNEINYQRKHRKGSGNYYEHAGQRWRLDNKGSGNYSPKSVDKKNTENGNTKSKRNNRLKAQTSSSVDPATSEATRAKINGDGKQHHHKVPASRADGLVEKYGGKIPEKVHQAHNKVGVHLGNDPRNFLGLTGPEHKAAHRQFDALDKSIKAADGGQYVFNQLKRSLGFSKGKNVMAGGVGFSGSLVGMAPELLQIADNYTDGKASEVVNGAINSVVQGAVNGYQEASERYKNSDNFDTL